MGPSDELHGLDQTLPRISKLKFKQARLIREYFLRDQDLGLNWDWEKAVAQNAFFAVWRQVPDEGAAPANR